MFLKRTRKTWAKLALSISTVVFVSACGNYGNVNTLDGMTTSTGFDGGYRKPINLNYPTQTRFLASNGLLLVNGPGDKCLAGGYRPASSFLCFSSSGQTEVAVRRFTFNGTASDLRDMRDALTDLQVEIVELATLDTAANAKGEKMAPVAPAQTSAALANKSKEIVEKARLVDEKFQANNFFIFRWDGASGAGGGGNAGGILSGRSAASKAESGLVIVGGLVVSNLLIGRSDWQDALLGYPKAAKIATYTMGAEHLLYFSDLNLSAALEADFSGRLKDLKNLSPATQAALNAYASIGKASETQGSFSSSPVIKMSQPEYEKAYSRQHIFYSTMTDIKTLVESISE